MKRSRDAGWEVTLVNRGKADVTLIQPGDGSECGWRSPIVEWVIDGKVPGRARCGRGEGGPEEGGEGRAAREEAGPRPPA